MKKVLLTLTVFVLAIVASAQSSKEKRYALYGIAFYNVENLFDTVHDYNKNDFEYLPEGKNKWNAMKYNAKLKNISKVLSQLCTDKVPTGAAVVGVSEIENYKVLEDLLKQPALAEKGWKYVQHEGPDRRGVDCAFFYNPRLFKFESSMLVPSYALDENQPDVDLGFTVDKDNKVVPNKNFLLGDTTHLTRGFLVMTGYLGGEKMHLIVNHWPSRAAESKVRERSGYQVYKLKEALLKQDPESKIVIMGDMNDDPGNKSMTKELKCKSEKADVKSEHDLYNPWYNTLYKKGLGTLSYRGKWNLFDQIVFSGNLLGKDTSKLTFFKNEIFVRDYLFQQEGRYKGTPHRTHGGGVWLNGYSDHLPTQIYLVKALK